jgi:putative ABC transport system permease protein
MNDPKPNRFALRVLTWFCPPHLLEEIEGDLLQKFERDVKTFGRRKAKRRLLWNVVRFFRPGIVLRNRILTNENQFTMLNNYFVTSVRHIKKSKVNFGFKIGGLALSIFSFLAVAIYISYQLSFDKFHENYQNIYRVTSEIKGNESVEKYANVPLSIGPLFFQHFKEISSFTRISYWNGAYIHYGEKVVDCEELVSADSAIFNTLSFQFLKGNKKALKSPNAIVLTKSTAERIFGSIDVLQKQLVIGENKKVYEVSAVVDDLPSNSHLSVEAMVLYDSEEPFAPKSILSPVLDNSGASAVLYLKFQHPISAKSFETKMEKLLDAYVSRSDREKIGFKLSLQSLQDIYFGPRFKQDIANKGNSIYLYSFSTLGILLLLVAAINYINLSIADFNNRARETGVRKVLGAHKHQLISQVVLETLIFSVLSFFIGLLMLYIFFPQIMILLDSNLRFSMLLDLRLLVAIFIGMVVLIFLSAWIPARQFAFSGIAQNLKSRSGGYNSFMSQGLLLAQFAISAICIACTFVAGKQVEFIHHKDLGIDRKNLIVFGLPWEFSVQQMKTLKQKLKLIPSVTSVTNGSFRIGEGYSKDWYYVESEEGFKKLELYEVFSDDELFETLGIKLLKGRTFNAQMPSDSGAAYVINETAAHELGWSNPIGKRIYTHPEEKGKWDGTVVGMVRDVNISPLYDKVHPLVMRLPWQNQYPDFFVYVRYQGEEQTTINAIGKTYKEVNPGYPFAFRFVDELYNHQHQKENKAFASLQFGTLVIVLVSMLGIFSMAAFISIKRMKEFGIRKVLGASIRQIASLHIGYFVRIALLANLVALPTAYFMAKEWLDTFAYRIDLTYAPFILVIAILFLVVIFSGGYSAWKSGRMNPIDVIKME